MDKPARYLGLFAILLLGATLVFGVAFADRLADLRRQAATADWPSASGTLLSKELRGDPETDGVLVVVEYAYPVGGEPHQANRVAFSVGWREQFRRFSDLEVGASLPVYYNPANPNEAVLIAGPHKPRVTEFWTFWAIFGAIIMVLWYAAIGGIVIGFVRRRQRQSRVDRAPARSN